MKKTFTRTLLIVTFDNIPDKIDLYSNMKALRKDHKLKHWWEHEKEFPIAFDDKVLHKIEVECEASVKDFFIVVNKHHVIVFHHKQQVFDYFEIDSIEITEDESPAVLEDSMIFFKELHVYKRG